MRHYILIIGFPFLLVVILASCSNDIRPTNISPTDSPADPYESKIATWESADVNRDVNAAIAKGDRRFLCVTGEGVYAPGLSAPEFTPGVAESQIDKLRFRIIDDTYDDINPTHGESIIRFKKTADIYARKYNLLLKKKLANE